MKTVRRTVFHTLRALSRGEAQQSASADADFDDLFSDQPVKNAAGAAQKKEDDLFGDDGDDDLFSDVSAGKDSGSGDDTDDFLKELFGDAPSAKSQQNCKDVNMQESIYP